MMEQEQNWTDDEEAEGWSHAWDKQQDISSKVSECVQASSSASELVHHEEGIGWYHSLMLHYSFLI